jgi:hypothetical protein
VGSQTANPAEFLYLMVQEYMAIAQGGPAPVTLPEAVKVTLQTEMPCSPPHPVSPGKLVCHL